MHALGLLGWSDTTLVAYCGCGDWYCDITMSAQSDRIPGPTMDEVMWQFRKHREQAHLDLEALKTGFGQPQAGDELVPLPEIFRGDS